MSENDELTRLFRNRLSDGEMTLREGFWEKLQSDLSQVETTETETISATAVGVSSSTAGLPKLLSLSPKFHRVAAAASVVLVLGAASAAFWYFSPKEEIKEAFTQVAALTPEGSLNGDVVQESFPSIRQANPTMQKSGMKHSINGVPAIAQMENEEGTVSVRVSITISQQVYGNRQSGNGYFDNRIAQSGNSYQISTGSADNSEVSSVVPVKDKSVPLLSKTRSLRKWAFKAGIGTSVPKGDFHLPLTASATVEHRLNSCLALETGLLYNRLKQERHTLGIPVKMNIALLSTPKVDLYATVGGAAEVHVGGVPDNDVAEPVRLSVAAGVGVRYKLSDRFALFAEPTVSHHFNADSGMRSLRTERPTNLNLLCGVRMTY